MIAALAIGLEVSLAHTECTYLYALTIGTAVICLCLSQDEEKQKRQQNEERIRYTEACLFCITIKDIYSENNGDSNKWNCTEIRLSQNQVRSAPDILENVVLRYKEGATAETP